MAAEIIKEKIKEVAALTEDYTEWVIPNGEIWYIGKWWGTANPQSDCHVCIIWDYEGAGEEIVAVTHSEQARRIDKGYVGDGTKKLVISLRNDTLSAEALAAGFDYKVL